MRQKIIDKWKKISKKRMALLVIPLVILCAALIFIVHYSVRTVTVLGNSRYSKEEIESQVCSGIFKYNTLLLSRFKNNKVPEKLELVDELDISMKDSHTIVITVQERQLVAYVKYLDCDIYFDGDGVVMDTQLQEDDEDSAENQDEDSEESNLLSAEVVGKTEVTLDSVLDELPLVEGLTFESVVMGQPIGGVDTSVFNTIQSISRMINKYEISPDKILFDEDMNITLDYDKITVYLGPDDLMEEKLTRMAAILKMLGSKKGELHLEDYDGTSENIIFSEADDDEDEESTDQETDDDSQQTYAGSQTDHSYALADKDRHKYYLNLPEGERSGSGLSGTGSAAEGNGAASSVNTQNAADTGNTDQTLTDTGAQTSAGGENSADQTGNTGDTAAGQTGQDANAAATEGNTAADQTQTDQTQTDQTQTDQTQTDQGASQSTGSASGQVTIDKPVLGNLPQTGQ